MINKKCSFYFFFIGVGYDPRVSTRKLPVPQYASHKQAKLGNRRHAMG